MYVFYMAQPTCEQPHPEPLLPRRVVAPSRGHDAAERPPGPPCRPLRQSMHLLLPHPHDRLAARVVRQLAFCLLLLTLLTLLLAAVLQAGGANQAAKSLLQGPCSLLPRSFLSVLVVDSSPAGCCRHWASLDGRLRCIILLRGDVFVGLAFNLLAGVAGHRCVGGLSGAFGGVVCCSKRGILVAAHAGGDQMDVNMMQWNPTCT